MAAGRGQIPADDRAISVREFGTTKRVVILRKTRGGVQLRKSPPGASEPADTAAVSRDETRRARYEQKLMRQSAASRNRNEAVCCGLLHAGTYKRVNRSHPSVQTCTMYSGDHTTTEGKDNGLQRFWKLSCVPPLRSGWAAVDSAKAQQHLVGGVSSWGLGEDPHGWFSRTSSTRGLLWVCSGTSNVSSKMVQTTYYHHQGLRNKRAKVRSVHQTSNAGSFHRWETPCVLPASASRHVDGRVCAVEPQLRRTQCSGALAGLVGHWAVISLDSRGTVNEHWRIGLVKFGKSSP